MSEHEPGMPSSTRDPHNPDGIRIVAADATGRRSRMIYQGLALFFAAACLGYVLMPRSVPSPSTAEDMTHVPETKPALRPETPDRPVVGTPEAATITKEDDTAGARPVASVGMRSLTPRRVGTHKKKDGVPDDHDPDQQPELVGIPSNVTAAEYIQALHDAGIYEGIGAFNPPGTSPPLEGLAVPEDYELPEGYVRHFQTTDDGQQIEPILMYSPDYEFYDANGNPVPIPDNRVVPPENAPPGFPVRPIQIPQPKQRDPGDLAR